MARLLATLMSAAFGQSVVVDMRPAAPLHQHRCRTSRSARGAGDGGARTAADGARAPARVHRGLRRRAAPQGRRDPARAAGTAAGARGGRTPHRQPRRRDRRRGARARRGRATRRARGPARRDRHAPRRRAASRPRTSPKPTERRSPPCTRLWQTGRSPRRLRQPARSSTA
ncbi:hypothetical protein DFH01_17170 [Falsiroseomonas bella]|uniref:Uncharacterized protein n=1 Tax=Falsiroseomonas bella TaxID=2184016 RepID=A0A317FCU3_9PROT|nr:hypothetical protein DFH01_17170 [Falsiroseomonas bella]